MTIEDEDGHEWPPANPILDSHGPVMQPFGFDYALFNTDNGEPFVVLTVHSMIGSFHFSIPSGYAIQSLKPMMEAMFADVAEPRPFVAKPKLIFPGS